MAVIPASTSAVDLTFTTLTGRVYTVEYNDTLLSPAAWTALSGATTVPGTGATILRSDPGVPPLRAYRLRIALALAP